MFANLLQKLAEHERSSPNPHFQSRPPGEMRFLSGLGPGEELIPECEVIYEDEDDGLDSKFEWCEKNPRHKNFTLLCELEKNDLPLYLRTDEVMAFIKSKADLTVRIRIPYTSKGRPDYIPGLEREKKPYPYMHHKGNKEFTRNGTGTVLFVSPLIQGTCPCPLCKNDPEPKQEYYEIWVRTVAHNVFNDEEACLAIVDCFFNNESDDANGFIEHVYGIRLDDSDGKKDWLYEKDVCDLICVSHDKETAGKLSELLEASATKTSLPGVSGLGSGTGTEPTAPFVQVIISHPHGCTKRISFGTIPYLTIPLKSNFKTEEPLGLPAGVKKYRVNVNVDKSPEEEEEKVGKKEEERDTTTKQRQKEEIPIPPGTTFTLPSYARYAMRYYRNESQSWLTFHPGTTLTPPTPASDEKDFQSTPSILVPDGAEFETDDSFQFENFYAGNIVGSCAGTSGAMIYSNVMENEILTDMEHTSKLRNGILKNHPGVTN